MGTVIRKKNEGISSFDTEDISLAMSLMNKGYELIFCHPNCDSSVIFHFKITSTIEKTAKQYITRNKRIDAEVQKTMHKMLNAYLSGVKQ
jgi:hypothetical protein